jgi:aryl-alcohol dehydrogenase-like predicted oxidoreductase
MTNSKGSPVVVGGATSAEQVVQNAAAGGITLSAAERAEIDEVSAPGPSKGDGMS